MADLKENLVEKVLELNRGVLQYWCDKYSVTFTEQDYGTYMSYMVGRYELPPQFDSVRTFVDHIMWDKGRQENYPKLRDVLFPDN